MHIKLSSGVGVHIFFYSYCDVEKVGFCGPMQMRCYVKAFALFSLFSLELFDMRIEKAAVFFDKIINMMFLLCFFCN